MEAAVATDEIEFTLWDDKKLAKKVEEYIAKGYTINEVMEQVLRPYKIALNKYFDVAVERSLRDTVPTLKNFKYHNSNNEYFFEQELRPQLESALDGVKMKIEVESTKTITITYHGYQCCLHTSYNYSSQGIRLTPNVGYEKYAIIIPLSTPLSAIEGFVRQMPMINRLADEYLVKAVRIYDKLMCQQSEVYNTAVEHLEALATLHAGKPVGKLMKYLRWSTERLLAKRCLYIPSIAVTGDTIFSYTERELKDYLTDTYEDRLEERWIDAKCTHVYSADPETTDAKEWIKANNSGLPLQRDQWKESVRDFAGPGYDGTFLSVDFINEKL